jgi:VCBS repeat protein/FG-GAP repeat protein
MSSGCAAGIVGLIFSLNANSNSGTAANNIPAQPVLDAPRRLSDGQVLLSLTVLDDDGGALDLKIEWQPLDGGDAFLPASEFPRSVTIDGNAYQSQGTRIQVAPNTPQGSLFIWDARSDLHRSLARSVSRVRLRITSGEEKGQSAPLLSDPFTAGNDPPAVLAVDPRARSGFIPIQVLLSDTTSDPVRLAATLYFGLDENGEKIGARPLTLFGGPKAESFETSPGGTPGSLLWDSVADLGRNFVTGISLEVVPLDTEAGAGLTFGPFTVDNNSDPVVQIMDVAGSPDRSHEFPIRFVLRDEEEQPVNVVLQWALENQPFEEISIPLAEPSADGLQAIEDILAGRDEDRRRALHILSEAPVLVRGAIDDSTNLPLNQIRAAELVRKGLLFKLPGLDGPGDDSSAMFLIGREIRLFEGEGDPGETRRILAFDPGTSIATLDADLPGRPSPRTRFEMGANEGLVHLQSSRAGLLHTFVWDSSRDLADSGAPLDARVRIRAIAFDSQGAESPESVFDVESGPLVMGQTLTPESLSSFPVSLAVGDLNGDGANDLIIANQGSDSASLYFFRQIIGGFDSIPSKSLPAGSGQATASPSAVALWDLNGDGKNDLLFLNEESATLEIFMASPSGELLATPSGTLSTGLQPKSLVVADLNGDSLVDLAVACAGSDIVQVFFHRPAGQLLQDCAAIPFPCLPDRTLSTDGGPRSLAAGDLDGDGTTDLAVVCERIGKPSGSLAIYFQDRDSRELGLPGDELTIKANHILATGARPHSVALGDLDGKGRNVVAVGNWLSNTVSIFLQDPSGDLGPIQSLPSGVNPAAVAIGDLNGDGKADIAVANQASDTIGIYLQQPTGSFLPVASQTLQSDGGPSALAIADVNRDSQNDLVVANETSGTVVIYLQRPSGSLPSTPSQLLQNGKSPIAISIGDLNGDGRNDAIAVNLGSGTADIFYQSLSGRLPSIPDLSLATGPGPSSGPYSLDIGDLNGDGLLDAAVANQGAQPPSIGILLQDPTGKLLLARAITLDKKASSLAIGDLNSDGLSDLALAQPDQLAPEACIFFQGTTGEFSSSPDRRIPSASRPSLVMIADLNGDGGKDLALGLFKDTADPRRALTIFLQAPDGSSLTESQTIHTDFNTTAFGMGDLDSDGRNDLAFYGTNSTQVPIFIQQSSALFLPEPQVQVWVGDLAGGRILIGDVSGDGRDDLLVNQGASNAILIFSQDAAGHLDSNPSQFISLPLVHNPGTHDFALGDLTGDGKNDLLVTNPNLNTTAVYLGR